MRPLIIDDTARANIARVVAYADQHRFTLIDIMHLMGHPEKAPGHTPGFVVVVPVGFRCVFTLEQQPPGMMRHLSVSVMEKERAPNPVALDVLLPLFGFTGKLKDCTVYPMHEQVTSINILELLK